MKHFFVWFLLLCVSFEKALSKRQRWAPPLSSKNVSNADAVGFSFAASWGRPTTLLCQMGTTVFFRCSRQTLNKEKNVRHDLLADLMEKLFFYLFTPFLPPFFFVPTFFLAFLHTRRRLLFPHVFFPEEKTFSVFFLSLFCQLPSWTMSASDVHLLCFILSDLGAFVKSQCLASVESCHVRETAHQASMLQPSTALSFFFVFLSFFLWKRHAKTSFSPMPGHFPFIFHMPGTEEVHKRQSCQKMPKKKEKNTFAEGREKRRKPQKNMIFPSVLPPARNVRERWSIFAPTVFQTYLPSLWHCRHK